MDQEVDDSSLRPLVLSRLVFLEELGEKLLVIVRLFLSAVVFEGRSFGLLDNGPKKD
jgi:hypothetical protein